MGAPGRAQAGEILKYRADQRKAEESTFNVASKRHDIYKQTMGALSSDPNLTKDVVAATLDKLVNGGLFSQTARDTIVRGLPDDPAALRASVMQDAKANLPGKDQLTAFLPELMVAGGNLINKNALAPGGAGAVVAPIAPTAFETARIPMLQQTANAATTSANAAATNAGVNRAGLGIRAIQADPFNLTGAQAAFPLTSVGGGGGGGGGGGAPRAGAPATPAPVPVGNTISGKQIPLGDAINQGLTGPELLSVMPKTLAGQVAAILDHRAAPPSGNSARTSQLMQIVQAADPTYDAQQYKTKQGIETAFTAGLPSRTLKSINVVDEHLKVLNSTIDALNNGDVKAFNQIGNAISTQMSVPAPTDFNAVKRIVADELAKAVIGGVGALGDRKSIDETINAASGPTALRSVIKRYQELMDGQRIGLADQYKSGGGNNAGVLSLLNKNKPAVAEGPKVGSTQNGYRFKGGNPADQSSWEKL
jgi:hypothetical protein